MKMRSQDINKSFGKTHNKFYPRRNMFEEPGWCSGKRIKMSFIALKDTDNGKVCPHCGSENINDGETYVTYVENAYGEKIPNAWQLNVEYTCADCSKVWRVFCVARPDVVYFNREV